MLPNKVSTESIIVTFDFTNDLGQGETISSASVTSTVHQGADSNPSTMISGPAIISGSTVLQRIVGGISGVIYCLTCTITTNSSNIKVLKTTIPVNDSCAGA